MTDQTIRMLRQQQEREGRIGYRARRIGAYVLLWLLAIGVFATGLVCSGYAVYLSSQGPDELWASAAIALVAATLLSLWVVAMISLACG